MLHLVLHLILNVFLYQVQAFSSYNNLIVHIDLKGAPPKLDYFKQLLTTASKLGATGVLIEWEDMFPFDGELSSVVNGNAYSEKEVNDILQHAQSEGLDVIPLVQTLAHMEWVLKTPQFLDLRDDPEYPMVACIGDQRAVDLIIDAVNQVMRTHAKYGTKYFHIGADEAFEIGICDADKQVLPLKYGNDSLSMIFDHLQNVALSIKGEYPETKVLMWYDELKTAPSDLIAQYNLNSLVTPVVWKYTPSLDKDLPPEMWKNLSYSFRDVWGGSAFKGADGANRYWNRMKPYLVNNKEWFLQREKHARYFDTFNSIILTGWQRYDHFASLCELFPTSVTSLAFNLIVVKKLHVSEEDVEQVKTALYCPAQTTINEILTGNDKCRFPGYQVRDAIRSFVQLKAFFDNSTWVHNREAGWLQNSHMLLNASNPYYIDAIGQSYLRTLKKLDGIIANLKTALNNIFYPDVAVEFVIDYIQPFYDDLKRRAASVQNVDSRKSYQPRPWFGPRREVRIK